MGKKNLFKLNIKNISIDKDDQNDKSIYFNKSKIKKDGTKPTIIQKVTNLSISRMKQNIIKKYDFNNHKPDSKSFYDNKKSKNSKASFKFIFRKFQDRFELNLKMLNKADERLFKINLYNFYFIANKFLIESNKSGCIYNFKAKLNLLIYYIVYLNKYFENISIKSILSNYSNYYSPNDYHQIRKLMDILYTEFKSNENSKNLSLYKFSNFKIKEDTNNLLDNKIEDINNKVIKNDISNSNNGEDSILINDKNYDEQHLQEICEDLNNTFNELVNHTITNNNSQIVNLQTKISILESKKSFDHFINDIIFYFLNLFLNLITIIYTYIFLSKNYQNCILFLKKYKFFIFWIFILQYILRILLDI